MHTSHALEVSFDGRGSPLSQEVDPLDLDGLPGGAFSGAPAVLLQVEVREDSFLASPWAWEGQGRGPSYMGPMMALLLLLLLSLPTSLSFPLPLPFPLPFPL